MELTDLKQSMINHTWRMRFAFLPVKRIKLVDGYVQEDGYYFWRIVFEVKVGLVPMWTAYSHMNDNLKFDG